MNLIETLTTLDKDVFLVINGMHTPFFDGFMFATSNTFVWFPFYLTILYSVTKHWKNEAIWVLLALVACVVITDQVSSSIIKKAVMRLRPSHAEELKGMVHLVRDYAGGMYGFVSSHAANTFGFALLTSLLLRNRLYTYIVFSWALAVAYSRIYLGVHYPLDVICGQLLGAVTALVLYWVLYLVRPKIVKRQEGNSVELTGVVMPVLVIDITFFGIFIYGMLS